MRKRIKLIANPISGGDARPRIEKVRQHFIKAGAQVDLFLTGKRGDATEEAARVAVDEFDLVVAAGGDGTLNEVANGLVGREIPLAFLPLGTANVMALEMGVPFYLEQACRIALRGEARPVTLADIDGNLFLMMAGVGFDAAAVRAVNSRLKRYTGKFAYLVAGLQALIGYRQVALELHSAEGESQTVWHVIISNIRLYGGRFVMAPDAGLERAGLCACVVEKPGRTALLMFYLRILLRGAIFGPIKRYSSASFRVTGGQAPVQIDGDDHGDTPLVITSRTHCLKLVFPDDAPECKGSYSK